MVKGRGFSWLLLSLAAIAIPPSAAGQALPTITPDFAIETTRILDETGDGGVSVSPEGTTYVARLVRGNLSRGLVEVEIITGSTTNLRSAVRWRSVAKLFSTGLGNGGAGGSVQELQVWSNPIHWLDETNIALLASDERGILQVATIDLRTGMVKILTHHDTDVKSFDVLPSGIVIFSAQARRDNAATEQRIDEGFVIDNGTDAAALFYRRLDGTNFSDEIFNSEWFLQRHTTETQISIVNRRIDPSTLATTIRPRLSPDGKLALVPTSPLRFDAAWSKYDDSGVSQAIRDPDFFTRYLTRWSLFDVETGQSGFVGDELTNAKGVIAWSPDSGGFILAPSLPVQPPAIGSTPRIEFYDPAGVLRATVELPAHFTVQRLRWLERDEIHLIGTVARSATALILRRSATGWKIEGAIRNIREKPNIALHIDQASNRPPRLMASARMGRKRPSLVVDPNPSLGPFRRGPAPEIIRGELENGVGWEGMIILPGTYDPARRYPLVIQSSYFRNAGENFSLYGPGEAAGTGPATIAAYPGRSLADKGMIVLQLQAHPKLGAPDEAASFMHAYEAAAKRLIDSGRVDSTRVGLLGFSRNGYFVEYTISHSSFSFAAAIAVDNFDPSYLSAALMSWKASYSAVNGAEPFGDGLKTWLEQAPGFNAEHVCTPLRMVTQSAGLFGTLNRWEMYSRLKYLKRPVELAVIPNVDRSAHNPQNPKQVLWSQRSVIDWFDFWLGDHIDSDPAKAKQYGSWKALKELQTGSSRSCRRSVQGH